MGHSVTLIACGNCILPCLQVKCKKLLSTRSFFCRTMMFVLCRMTIVQLRNIVINPKVTTTNILWRNDQTSKIWRSHIFAVEIGIYCKNGYGKQNTFTVKRSSFTNKIIIINKWNTIDFQNIGSKQSSHHLI